MPKSRVLDLMQRGPRARKFIEFASTRIIGQPRIVEEVGSVIERVQAGFLREDKPCATILIVGPTGVGKTLTPKVAAEFLVHDARGYTRLDGQNFSERHEVASLKGAPVGYVGYGDDPIITQEKLDEPGWLYVRKLFLESLSNRMRERFGRLEERCIALLEQRMKFLQQKKPDPVKLSKIDHELHQIQINFHSMGFPVYDPYEECYLSVLLIDEIERAHRAFHNATFRIFDEGLFDLFLPPPDSENAKRLQHTAVDQVRFQGTIIIATSNVGSDEIKRELRIMSGKEVSTGFSSNGALSEKELDARVYDICRRALDREFEAPFLNRFDKIIAARPLFPDSVRQILETIEIPKLHSRLEGEWKFPVLIKMTDAARSFIVEKATDNLEDGARLLQRKLQDYVENPLAAAKNTGQVRPGDVVHIGVVNTKDGKKLKFKTPPVDTKKVPIVIP